MKKLKKTNKKLEQRGITLIALVVTIIVLLILAGVSIAMITGQSGILGQAKDARTKTAHAEVYEALELEVSEHLMKEYTGEYTGSLIEYLLNEKHYIREPEQEGIEGYIIDAEKLVGSGTPYGKGTDERTDVYKLEESKETKTIGKVASTEPIRIADTSTETVYDVIYYGKTEKENVKLGSLVDVQTNKEVAKKIIKFGLKNNTYGETVPKYYEAEEGMTFREWALANGWIDEYDYPIGGVFLDDLDAVIEENKIYTCSDVAECISGDSFVTTSIDGKKVLAKDVKDGQDILFYNFETNSLEVGIVKKAFEHALAKNFIKYEFEDGTILKVTDYHPIYTREGWKSYTERNGYPIPKIGDEVKTLDGWKKIINIEELSVPEDCYNFLVKTKNGESVKNFFANNVLVEAITNIE